MNVFSYLLNSVQLTSLSRRLAGKLFQIRGPAAAKHLSPKRLWTRETEHGRGPEGASRTFFSEARWIFLGGCVRRISGRNCRSSSRTQNGSESPGASDADDLGDAALHSSHWTFSKVPFKTSLIAGQTHEFEDISVRMFNSALVYSGLELSGKTLLRIIFKLATRL